MKRSHGITAYVELPAQLGIFKINSANSLCEKKTLKVDGKPLNIKLFYCDHQIYINKLPSNINKEDVEEYFGKFGKVLKVII